MPVIWNAMVPMWRHCSDRNETVLNTLRPRQNGRHFADDIFKCIFLNVNAWISIKISLKFVPKSRVKNITALVQIMGRRRLGDKPLSEAMMVELLTHICAIRSQWVNRNAVVGLIWKTRCSAYWNIPHFFMMLSHMHPIYIKRYIYIVRKHAVCGNKFTIPWISVVTSKNYK